jgi:hypothetical protein
VMFRATLSGSDVPQNNGRKKFWSLSMGGLGNFGKGTRALRPNGNFIRYLLIALRFIRTALQC